MLVKYTNMYCVNCGGEMELYHIRSYRNLDNELIKCNIRWTTCEDCGTASDPAAYEKLFELIPPGSLVSNNSKCCEMRSCRACGLTLRSFPITTYLNEDARILSVPYFMGVKCYLCGRGYVFSPKQGTIDDEFRSLIHIPEKVSEQWNIRLFNLLESRSKYSGSGIFKFSYSPKFKELIVDEEFINHKRMIERYGTGEFVDYIRGIYFKHRNTIYLRMHEELFWLVETFHILRRMGVPRNIKIVWGPTASQMLSDDLAGL